MVTSSVLAQSDPAPTSAPAPTTPPAVERPPSAERPPSEARPTSAPQPTSNEQPTSPPVPTSVSQPTGTTSNPSGTNPSPIQGTVSTDSDITGGQTTSQNSSGDNGLSTDNSSNNTDSGTSSSSGSVNDPANIGTGPYSTNYASEVNQNWQEVLNQNLAQLQNKIDAVSSTGFNYANLNTLDGQVFSGDTIATLNLLNKLNSNMSGIGGFSVFNVYDTYVGDIVFQMQGGSVSDGFNSASSTVSKNAVTGPGSTNEALADNSFTVREANGNDAQLVNDINLQAITGGNSASFNTGNGKVTTGNASALANIINLVNTNLHVSQWLFGVVNVFGTLAGNIILPKDTNDSSNSSSPSILVENSNTGPLSSNNASYSDSNAESYATTNAADISSTLNVAANSGNNNASINTGGGSVTTGSSDTAVSNNTIANSNTVNEDGTVWLVIVNKMGRWVGEIIGAPWGSSVASNSLPVTQTNSQNNYTGPLSTNNSTYNSTADTSVANNNTAGIVNNITANADTGNNQAQYNTGEGAIETGNAKAGVNLFNMVNTNVVAKKFVAVFVNVLGTFLGDVVSPEQQAKQTAYLLPTPTVTNSSGQANVGGLPVPTTAPSLPAFSTNTGSSSEGVGTETTVYSENYYLAGTSDLSPEEYSQAVNQVAVEKTRISSEKRQILSSYDAVNNYVDNKAKKFSRGLFLSPAFAKATETSFAGMLLGGATLKIDQSWLSLIPFALLLIILRRRKNIDLTKYLNSLLEIVL